MLMLMQVFPVEMVVGGSSTEKKITFQQEKGKMARQYDRKRLPLFHYTLDQHSLLSITQLNRNALGNT